MVRDSSWPWFEVYEVRSDRPRPNSFSTVTFAVLAFCVGYESENPPIAASAAARFAVLPFAVGFWKLYSELTLTFCESRTLR